MLHIRKPYTAMAITLFSVIAASGLAFKNRPVNILRHGYEDTTPKKEKIKQEKTVIEGDIDNALEQVEKAQKNIEQKLENRDWEQIQRNLGQTLEKLNSQKIQEQVQRAMKQIDKQQIELKAQQALRNIDWEKMEQQMEKAQESLQKEFNEGKMQEQMQMAMQESAKALRQMKNIDMEKMHLNLEKVHKNLELNQDRIAEEIEMAKKSINKNFSKDFKKEFEKAHEGINRAKEELQNYKNMLIEMDKDGLLKADGPYDVHYKNGELMIDGKTQPSNITDKYKHYFKKGDVRIRKGKDGDDDKTIDL